MSEKIYVVNEAFLSIQGEGKRTGTVNVFLRFAGCNLACDVEAGERSPGGFACDTEFASGRRMSAGGIGRLIEEVCAPHPIPGWIILTGGEPALQVDEALMKYLGRSMNFRIAIETNGSIDVSAFPFDWITVSPKVAEHAIKQRKAHEVKYVRGHGQAIPKTVVEADYKLISPAFDGNRLDQRSLEWCIGLVKDNPEWELSVQQHKAWRVR